MSRKGKNHMNDQVLDLFLWFNNKTNTKFPLLQYWLEQEALHLDQSI